MIPLQAEQEELGRAEVESRKKAFLENEGNPVCAVNGSKEPSELQTTFYKCFLIALFSLFVIFQYQTN